MCFMGAWAWVAESMLAQPASISLHQKELLKMTATFLCHELLTLVLVAVQG